MHFRRVIFIEALKNRKGQALVEFAIILPILLLLVMGIIEFGLIFNAYLTIQNASREGARYGITGASDADIVSLVRSDCSALQSTYLTVNVTPAEGSRITGDTLVVSVSYSYHMVTPIISSLFSNVVVLNAQTSMRME